MREGELIVVDAEARAKAVAAGTVIARDAIVRDGVRLHHPVHLSGQTTVYAPASIGKYSFLNGGTVVFPHVTMGAFCMTGRGVQLGTARHPVSWLSTHSFQMGAGLFPRVAGYDAVQHRPHRMHEPTTIGNDVWFGAGAQVVSGLAIGDGAVIAAGAVVVHDVAPYTIVGGVPARPIRPRFEPDVVAALLELRWWDLSLAQIADLPFDDVVRSIERLREIRAALTG